MRRLLAAVVLVTCSIVTMPVARACSCEPDTRPAITFDAEVVGRASIELGSSSLRGWRVRRLDTRETIVLNTWDGSSCAGNVTPELGRRYRVHTREPSVLGGEEIWSGAGCSGSISLLSSADIPPIDEATWPEWTGVGALAVGAAVLSRAVRRHATR